MPARNKALRKDIPSRSYARAGRSKAFTRRKRGFWVSTYRKSASFRFSKFVRTPPRHKSHSPATPPFWVIYSPRSLTVSRQLSAPSKALIDLLIPQENRQAV